MYLTGFADEASQNLDQQIKVTKELGWKNIESRCVDGINLHNLNEEDFQKVVEKLNENGVKVNCFGSAIANWASQIDAPFEDTLEMVDRAIPRMKQLGTQLIRIMSYARRPDGEDQMAEERFRRLREITHRFLDAGLTPVHENCMNYGGMSYQHTLEMIENVPGLKLVFDTGNPVFNLDYSKSEKTYQDAWEFYQAVVDHVEYIHIKDAHMEGDKCIYKYCGEGDAYVPEILKDLKQRGYNGGISIEPHLAAVFHAAENEEVSEEESIRIYKKYGEMLMTMLKEIDYSWE